MSHNFMTSLTLREIFGWANLIGPFRPYRFFHASRETMASDPEDQSVNPANSEVVLNCVAFFYEEGKGGKNYRKKNKFRCLVK